MKVGECQRQANIGWWMPEEDYWRLVDARGGLILVGGRQRRTSKSLRIKYED